MKQDCYCAFCKTPRSVYGRKHIGWTNVLLSLALAMILMLTFWEQFDPRVLVIFVLSLVVGEVFVQLRWRLSLSCPHCGFDPLLYMKDSEKAADKVRAFYEEKLQEPNFYLTNSPLLKLQRHRQIKKSSRRNKMVSSLPSNPI